MTVSIGFVCDSAIVLAADQEVSAKGLHKFNTEKLFVIDMNHQTDKLFLAYAGSPHLMEETVQRIQKAVDTIGPDESANNKGLLQICQDILFEIAQRSYEEKLQVLIVVATVLEQAELWCFNQNGFHRVDRYEFLGVGESSVLRYLFEVLYSRKLTLIQSKNLAVYAVAKAKKYIEGCGGPTDVLLLPTTADWEWMSPIEIEQCETVTEKLEASGVLRNLIS